MMKTKIFLFTLLLHFAVCLRLAAASAPDLHAVLAQLDSCLLNAKSYDDAKEARIDTLRKGLQDVSGEQRYNLLIKLYHEYGSYKYDSAYVYASRSLEMARQMANPEWEIEAASAVVFCQCSAGLYKEAFDSFAKITLLPNMSQKYKAIYYETAARLYYDISDYNHSEPYQQEYVRRGGVYTDSLLQYISQQSGQWWMVVGRRQMKERNFAQSQASFSKYLECTDIDDHGRAIVLSSIGWMHLAHGQTEKSIIATAGSAIYDVKSSTKEITSLITLSELLYKQGDIKRAIRYVTLALQSANFYNARQRKIEVGNILPLIGVSRSEMLKRERNVMVAFTLVSLLLAAIIAYLLIQSVKKSKKLKEANNLIKETNTQLADTNNLLVTTNAQLREADRVKEGYIASSLMTNAVHIEQMERLYQLVQRKLATKQYADLKHMLTEGNLMKERDNMFSNFDETFLKIFPHFVEEYNKLFPPEEQRQIASGEPLPTEMRIFALIRLGIADNERIARFLDKSVNTVKTYKTRVKNKSLAKNENFEELIMLIDRQ